MTAPQQGHTPGPWDMDEGDFSVYQLETIEPITGAMDELPNGEANARLIAAAPDLLAALHDIANHAAMGRPLSAESLARIAAAAIAKATA